MHLVHLARRRLRKTKERVPGEGMAMTKEPMVMIETVDV